MTESNRVTDEDVLSAFRRVSDPNEALSTREVSEALDCSRRTAYNRLSALADSDHLRSKKVGSQVRIWWVATAPDNPRLGTVDGDAIAELTSSQTLQVELHSEQMAQAIIERNGASIDVTIEEVVSLDDETQLQYWSVSGIGLDAYVELMEGQPESIDVRVLSSVDGTHRVEIHSTTGSLYSVIEDHDGRLTGGTVENGTLKIVSEFPATVEEAALVEDMSAVYGDLEVASRRLLSTPKLSRQLLEATLSERQWTTLQLAYYAGYFDRPRTSNGEEIAERMGITRQTFNRHLREAEERLAQFVMEDMDGDRSEALGAAERTE